MNRTVSLIIAATLVAGIQAAAQQPGHARLRGYVYDSLLTGATMPGALVLLSGAAERTVETDYRGRFFLDSLPPGTYTLSFRHPSLSEIGYSPPAQTARLPAGVVTSVFLSTTSGREIRARLCPDVVEGQTGVVLGQLSSVRTRGPIPGGEVVAEWNETVVSADATVSRHDRQARAVTDSLGRYVACGVPNDVPVMLRARAPGHEGPPLELDLERRAVGVQLLTLDLADSTAAESGTAVLRGTVLGNDRAPIAEAQVLVLGSSGGVRTNASGGYELTGLPAGTHTIEARAIGFERRRDLVNLDPERPAALDFMLTRLAVVLPELAVTERAAPASPFDERRKSAAVHGYFITRDDIIEKHPLRTEDIFRGVPGLSVVPSGGFDFQVVSTRGVTGSGRCSPDFYVDGARVVVDPRIGGGIPVEPQDVYGIETYSATSAPAEYPSSGCGLVLIWTMRGRK